MVSLTQNIALLQSGIAQDVLICHHLNQLEHLVLKVVALAVEVMKQRVNRVKVSSEARVEMT